jgi:hypothetical protein
MLFTIIVSSSDCTTTITAANVMTTNAEQP